MSLALALGPHALIGCGAAPEPAYPLLMSIEAPTEALRGDTLRGVVHMTNASSEPVAERRPRRSAATLSAASST